MLSIASRLEQATERPGGRIVFVTPQGHVPVEWARLHEQARAAAAALQARGVGAGDHVAILGPTSRDLVTAIQAVWLAGACVVVLPLPMRMGSLDDFVAQTRARILGADCALVLVDGQLAPFIEAEPGDPPFAELGDVLAGTSGAERYVRPADDLERLAILQFTSGSTSAPKGVMLPERVLGANLDALAGAAGLDVDVDVLVSWLPLYHDMGLVGLLCTSMMSGADLVLAAPQDFLAHPGGWMEWISAYRGTATAGPNFSYVLAARALKRAHDLDLSSLRIALNGAEPVDPATVEAFLAAGAPFGLQPGSAFPAFGMAELAIAGTFPEPGRGLVVDTIDRRVLEAEHRAVETAADARNARRIPLLGRPVPGLEIRVCDPGTGQVLAEREVGELEIRGTSVTPGYYRRPDATAASFHDEWLKTGDLAYLVGEELVLCGRIKDVIIVGGRNVFPEDIERAVANVEGVRAGNVIAFGVEGRKGKETVVVVAEARAPGGDPLDPVLLRRFVHHRVLEVTGVPPHDVVLVEPGTLPKTSSGKLQRSLCRTRYLGAELVPV
ncbi:MAG: AMP-binding protein [Acidimicrobiales bacterium]|nr:AMP-binding protein [Acidimicrobiales bacterium]